MRQTIIVIIASILVHPILSAQSQTNFSDTLLSQRISEIVVTGTRFAIPIEKSGKTIYKLDSNDLEKNAGKSVSDIINEVPGIQIDGNFGAPGSNISVFARGGRNKNVLILIDGVPLNDPSGVNAIYDLRLLSLDQIESIEVLKGGASSLYGTGASSAVINIVLKKGSKESNSGTIGVNYGSFQTLNTHGNINGHINGLTYLLSGSYTDSQGFSAASGEQSTEPFDKDGFEKKSILLKLGHQFGSNVQVEGLVAYDNFDTQYDDAGFIDGDNLQKGKMFRVGIVPKYTYDKGILTLKTTFASTEQDFQSSFPALYKGRNLQMDLNQHHRFSKVLTGLWGVNLQSLSYDQENTISFDDTGFTLVDPYASILYEPSSEFEIHAAARLNTHSEYGSHFVYNFNPSYLFSLKNNQKIKIFASAASTYITPTGFQLFSSFGNKELEPETSLNFEVGGSLYLGKDFTLNASYFDRKEENAIDFVSLFDDLGNWIGGEYQNIADSRKVTGIELDIAYRLSDKVSFAADYSHVSSDNPASFYRIPKNKFGISTSISPNQQLSINVKYHFTGDRSDFDFGSFQEVNLKSYSLLDIYAQMKFYDEKLTAFVGINNVFDENFVGVLGFTTRGINYNIGLKYAFGI